MCEETPLRGADEDGSGVVGSMTADKRVQAWRAKCAVPRRTEAVRLLAVQKNKGCAS